MKRNPSKRTNKLALRRETLRLLDKNALRSAPGGSSDDPACTATYNNYYGYVDGDGNGIEFSVSCD